ncbi:hypothetical protein KGF54_000780 [Candida jiufengensis]|uniref:uncharacterized protein n=1 Tax=Candida jiufengensis TaxID=497108 RepID=UPI00222459E0|nr:uncharacterized protein KGF54_000780 [Candida jiufengensis]KAI5956305.1 hypothetical protein KGF54_000780 [Candida jiufengensis]
MLSQETSDSNNIDSFMSSLLNNRGQIQTQTQTQTQSTDIFKSQQDTPATLISRAARLELESITLKESLKRADDLLKSLSTEGALSKLNAIQDELQEVKEVVEHRETKIDLLAVDIKSMDKNSLILKRVSEEINLVKDRLFDVDIVLKTLTINQENINSQFAKQNETLNELLENKDNINDGIDEIKQFLNLLLPRFVSLESLLTRSAELKNSTSISPFSSGLSQETINKEPHQLRKRRKLL